MQNLLTATALLISVGTVGCESPTMLYHTAHIDPQTMKITLTDHFPWPAPSGQGYFQRLNAVNGYTLQYIAPDGRPDWDSLWLTNDSVITTDSKLQVLLKGEYGTVYLRTTYFYPPERKPQPVEFYADLWLSDPNQRLAENIPAIDQTRELSAITVIRIFRAPPGFLVVCATYESDGRIAVLSVDGSKNGEWIHSNNLSPLYRNLDVATSFGDRPRTREYFGLPETFPISDYLRTYRNISKPASLPVYQDVINLHYQRNEFVRQDFFSLDRPRKTEFLHYPLSSAFALLKPVDDKMQFVYRYK